MTHIWKILSLSLILFAFGCTQTSSETAPPTRPVASTGQTCGGMMGTTCSDPKDYCHMDVAARCGAADQTGTCRPRPEMCTQQYDPVCGCDGKTYGNACSANSKGVSVAQNGACES